MSQKWLERQMKNSEFKSVFEEEGRKIAEVDAFINAIRNAGIKIPFQITENELARFLMNTVEE